MGPPVNLPVRNKHTGVIHRGTVNSETNQVISTSCGKAGGDHYEIAKDEQLNCAVCRAKLLGKAIGVYNYQYEHGGRRGY